MCSIRDARYIEKKNTKTVKRNKRKKRNKINSFYGRECVTVKCSKLKIRKETKGSNT